MRAIMTNFNKNDFINYIDLYNDKLNKLEIAGLKQVVNNAYETGQLEEKIIFNGYLNDIKRQSSLRINTIDYLLNTYYFISDKLNKGIFK